MAHKILVSSPEAKFLFPFLGPGLWTGTWPWACQYREFSPFTFSFQEPLCKTNNDLECVRNQTGYKTQISKCYKRCNGLIVSSFTETNSSRETFFKKFEDMLSNYSDYRGRDFTGNARKSKMNMF